MLIKRYIDHNARNAPVKSKNNPRITPHSDIVLGKANTPAPRAVDIRVIILPLNEP